MHLISRGLQVILLVSTLALSWLAMMATHELGHVFHAWVTGGTVAHVSFPLIGFSQTHLSDNPSPHFVAWGGALWGCVIPLIVLGVAVVTKVRLRFVIRFVAGFCLVANGVYLAAGSFIGAGDAGDLMRLGSPQWVLLCFGAIVIPLGLSLWNGLGMAFGIGPARGKVDRLATGVTLFALVAAIILVVLAG